MTFSIIKNQFLIKWVIDFRNMKKIKFKKIFEQYLDSKHEKFDKIINLINNNINENHMIFIKEMMIEMTIF